MVHEVSLTIEESSLHSKALDCAFATPSEVASHVSFSQHLLKPRLCSSNERRLLHNLQWCGIAKREISKIRGLSMAPESTTADAKAFANAGDENLARYVDSSHVGESIVGDVEIYARRTMTRLKSPESVDFC